MGKVNDITVTGTTPNPTNIQLTDVAYLSYLQMQELIEAIKALTLSIRSIKI